MWKLTGPEVLTAGGGVQVAANRVEGSVHLKVTVPLKPFPNATSTVASIAAPCVTWKLAAVGVRVNGCVTVTAALVEAASEPEVPVNKRT
jgi:hypothetical protein